jgi:hypothetical protein
VNLSRKRWRAVKTAGWSAGGGLLVAAVALVTSFAVPAHASDGISHGEGVGSCGFSTSSAHAFWSNTPYYNMELYVGGDEAACPASASFESTVGGYGFHFMPLWVGPQDPCTSFGNVFSTNTSTAYSQGRTQENDMANTMRAWGMSTTGAPVIYDLEGYNTTSTCVAAAQSFIAGWDNDAYTAPVQVPGVYGSTCGSDLTAFASLGSNVPNFIDGADYDGNKNTTVMQCVPSLDWVHSQRLKQYNGDHSETWNGVTVTVDSDCANGPMYPSGDNANEGCG